MTETRPKDDERRRFWRAAFHAAAQLTLPDGVREAELLDVSLKGALVELRPGATALAGQRGQLRLPLGNGGEAIIMQATVAHVGGRRVGLRCESIDLDSITHLRRLVELNAGDPDLLERELAVLLREQSGS